MKTQPFEEKWEHRFLDGPDTSWHPGRLTNLDMSVKLVYEERQITMEPALPLPVGWSRLNRKNMETETEKDSLLLKWGTLKGWHMHSEKGRKLLEEYHELGASLSVMMQKDTPRQKEIILELIDECNGTISNDWDGTDYTNDKEAAKRYILDYGKEK